MVNRNTASAAEIVSGAIQDHDRGLIVGETTFGKGLVQTVYPLSENTGLALTTARYYTPSGRLIQRDYNGVSLYDYYYARDEEGDNAPPPKDNANREVKLTDSGRTVYGGGGITPDVKLANLKTNHLQQVLFEKYAFFNFAKRFLANRKIDNQFNVDDAVMQDFRKFLDEQKITFTEAEFSENNDWLRSNIKAELFLNEFGQAEGMHIKAATDPYVIKALDLLPQAKLLADNARHVIAQRNSSKIGEQQ
jgi:carboxyl-terminal processing protease